MDHRRVHHAVHLLPRGRAAPHHALGIGGIAISLGFQDTLSNLIGGLQVSLLRIIKPGDNIEVGSSTAW